MNILLIDDELLLIQNLQDFLSDYDFNVTLAGNGQEGLDQLKLSVPDIVIVDLNMPVMDGYEFTLKANQYYPQLPIIVISGVGMIEDAMLAIRNGAWDFISKPLSDMQLVIHTIDKCMEKVRLLNENEKHRNHLETLVRERTQELLITQKKIIACLGAASEYKDTDTGFHVNRVASITYVLASALGLDESFCRVIEEASSMHDVGKIGIEDKVLLKKGKLDAAEWAHMKQHVKIGCSILCAGNCDPKSDCFDLLLKNDAGSSTMIVAQRIALFHHERWDGSGYISGLAKTKIPIEARIVALADFYDAVSSKRPYKEPFSQEECERLINEGRGSQFDPLVVDTFFANIDTIKQIKKDDKYCQKVECALDFKF